MRDCRNFVRPEESKLKRNCKYSLMEKEGKETKNTVREVPYHLAYIREQKKKEKSSDGDK